MIKKLFRNFKIGRAFGVDIFVNTTWFFLIILIIDWYPFDLIKALSQMAVLIGIFASVVVHEYGHILQARKYGMKTDKVVLHILGGAAVMEDLLKLKPREHFWVAVMGPLTSLGLAIIMGLITWGSFQFLSGDHWFTFGMGILSALNMLMFLFNLLPIYPMDGGRILRASLEMRGKDPQKVIYISGRTSQFFCGFLFGAGVALQGILMILIAILFFVYATIELRRKEAFL